MLISDMFRYPIGVQLFNRPEYARLVLQSLLAQTMSINVGRLHIIIDGFKGSFYEMRGDKDKTDEVAQIANDLFPGCTVIRNSINRGAGTTFNSLQHVVFDNENDWAFFLEEDVVLNKEYLEEISNLIAIVEPYDLVVKVACFQVLPTLYNLDRGFEGFYPGLGTKAFAERKDFYESRHAVLDKFQEIEALDRVSPCQNIPTISEYNSYYLSLIANFHRFGILQSSFNHDVLIDNFLLANNKVHVVTRPYLATDIGYDGMHNNVTPNLFTLDDPKFPTINHSNRAISFHESLPQIIKEGQLYFMQSYTQIMKGYYDSLSKKSMSKLLIKKIVARAKILFSRSND